MQVSPIVASRLKSAATGVAQRDELEFYQAYEWCLNPYLTVGDAAAHLCEEVDRLSTVSPGWQSREVSTNIYLLACGLLNCVDEYLRGDALRLPKRLGVTIVGRVANRVVEAISVNPLRRQSLRNWRERWLASFDGFLRLVINGQDIDGKSLVEAGRRLTALLQMKFPADLQALRLGLPIPFNRLCLTPDDYLSLGNEFVRRYPDRAQPILLLGLRTSGTYFVPLLKAFFALRGYENVELATIEPSKGPGRLEGRELERLAARGYYALIVDDAPNTSRTLLGVFDRARRIGFPADHLKIFVPTHAAKPTWFKSLPDDAVVTLAPEQWRKRQLLEPASVELRLAEYFRSEGFPSVSVIESRRADEFNAQLQSIATDDRGARLKRVFEVQLQASDGAKHTKYVLAKSVSWGWLGYHAFLMGHRLRGHVPRILGLRDSILFMEWTPQPASSALDRNTLIDASADYVAARVRHLRLGKSAVGMDLKKHNNGSRILEMAFSRAYGFLPGRLMRPHLGQLVRERPCPFPTHVDGNMLPREWIVGPEGPLKTDYEHHGFGRGVLNVVDPAYDLADTILNLQLSAEEERRLVERYAVETADGGVEQRLFMCKILAGLWAMSQCQEQLFAAPRGGNAQRDYHRRFLNAWNFLTVHAARYCGSLCSPPFDRRWGAPLVILDIDGVLDRRLFGFPCATAAGIEALSQLAAHDCSVAFNSARSAAEVKDYCKAYSVAGGIAEHGSYLWDAVEQREQVLISAETVRQLEELRRRLVDIPGVFLDERHRYSIRAFTYRDKPPGLIQSQLSWALASSIGEGAMAPISTHIMHQLLVDLQLDRLAFHHTFADTTVVAKEVDKGTGLVSLRDWVLGPKAETVAVGDDPADLPMFRAADRSLAPANIICRREAELFGCKISPYPFQRGLLDIAHKIVHPNGETCEKCGRIGSLPVQTDDLVLSVLQAADQTWGAKLRRALRERTAYRTLLR